MKNILALLLSLVCAISFPARAEMMDDYGDLQELWEEVLLDCYANEFNAAEWETLRGATERFFQHLQSPAGKALWLSAAPLTWEGRIEDRTARATLCGEWQARMEHVLAVEMLGQQWAGNVPVAQAWRALIHLPRHANAVEGALALQRLGGDQSRRESIAQLLAKEVVSWQTGRIREKLDNLKRTVADGNATTELIAARLAEVQGLATFPPDILRLAKVEPAALAPPPEEMMLAARSGDGRQFLEQFAPWRIELEAGLPNLLNPEEVARRERMLVKLLYLVPKEYQAGVRDGEVVVPLEYREAQTFMVQAEQLVNELSASWRTSRAVAYRDRAEELRHQLEESERLIRQRAPAGEVERAITLSTRLLEKEFGISLQRQGPNLVDETILEVRSLLARSLGAAQAGKWREAETARLDAYTSFDTAIESRVLPRSPDLAMRAERSFLEGEDDAPGIKAGLDARLRGAALEKIYQRTLTHVAECQALLKVSVSPATVTFTTASIVMREGLEAVVILAALLAGLRGVEYARPRKFLISGAWCALAATGLTFWASRTVVKSLSSYGEKLEAVISILAVAILLMVTNWVFHKVYWVQWNAKLRHLTKAVEKKKSARWEWLGLIGVGFLTIYREGFETSLFLQSLILEGGVRPVAYGVAAGAVFIIVVGLAIFGIGARLPYRKLLIITGVLVVSILVTFLGSTVRLFQTVGWMPIHPITGLHIPPWMGLWFGLYPSWEGMLIPPAGLAYVASAWLYMKWTSRLKMASAPLPREVSRAEPIAAS